MKIKEKIEAYPQITNQMLLESWNGKLVQWKKCGNNKFTMVRGNNKFTKWHVGRLSENGILKMKVWKYRLCIYVMYLL
jgi:hypothetical protein